MLKSCEPIRYIQYETGNQKEIESEIIAEVPVSLSVNGESWLTFMCTPVDLEALAVGFLYNEGIIQSKDDIEIVRQCDNGHNVDVWLNHNPEKPSTWTRTTGCTGGVTSVVGIKSTSSNHLKNGAHINPSQILSLVNALFSSQDLYRRSGGVHTSTLSDGKNIIVKGEDIGRHNTLDKIAGKLILNNLDPQRRIIITTGRISSEMLQKAVRMGVPIIISRTSPSSLSIRMADKWGITIIGYARRYSFRVYTHPDRVTNLEKLQIQYNHP